MPKASGNPSLRTRRREAERRKAKPVPHHQVATGEANDAFFSAVNNRRAIVNSLICLGSWGASWFSLLAVVIYTMTLKACIPNMCSLLRLDAILPDYIGVIFEEITLSADCYCRPYVCVGHLLLIVLICVCFLPSYATLHGGPECPQQHALWMELYPGLVPSWGWTVQQHVSMVCVLMTQVLDPLLEWPVVWGQYRNKYRLRRLLRQKGAPHADQVVQEEVKKVIFAVEDVTSNSQDPMIDFALHGTEYCLKYLQRELQRVVDEGGPTLDANGSCKRVPLYRRWQKLFAVSSAAKTVLALRAGGNDSQVCLVQSAHRVAMEANVVLAQGLTDAFLQIADAQRTSSLSVVDRLVLADRQHAKTLAGTTERPAGPPRRTLPAKWSLPPALRHHKAIVDSEPKPTGSSVAVIEPIADDEELESCVACFERAAVIVFVGCGHQAYCKSCRGKALKKAYPDWTDSQSYARLLRRWLRCPLCREESPTTEIAQHKGTVFRLGGE